MKKMFISVVIIVGFAGYLWYQHGTSPETSPSPSVTDTASSIPTATASPTASASISPTKTPTPVKGAVKSFTISGQNFSFTPSEIRVNKGDTVKITFKNEEGQHDWVIDEFQARTNVISGGQQQTIQFVADKSGTFEYYCSVGTHRLLGMHGNLIVQ